MSDGERLIHGTALAVAVDADGPLAGLLLLGPSGAGKSVLALDLIEHCPWRRTVLVADDVVAIEMEGPRLFAASPAPLSGLIEVRGFGPASADWRPRAAVRAVFDLAAPSERMPCPGRFPFEGPAEGPASAPLYPFRMDAPSPAARARRALRSILVDKSADARTIASGGRRRLTEQL